MGIIPSRPLYARFLLTLVVCGGFGIGFLSVGGGTVILPWIQGVEAVIACDNDGTADAGETCSNCPYDVRCTAAQKCIAGACSSASWFCKREDVCGDGWVSSTEKCDNGGICTGSLNASYSGQNCFTLDPAGDKFAGVARCRATGGVCVAQDDDGCTRDCQTECHEDGAPCLLASDCCGNACGDGVCGAGGGGGAVCGNGSAEIGESCGEPGLSCSGGQICRNCTCYTDGLCSAGQVCSRVAGVVTGCGDDGCGSCFYCVHAGTNIIIGNGESGVCRAFADTVAFGPPDYLLNQCFENSCCPISSPNTCSVNNNSTPGQPPGVCGS